MRLKKIQSGRRIMYKTLQKVRKQQTCSVRVLNTTHWSIMLSQNILLARTENKPEMEAIKTCFSATESLESELKRCTVKSS